MPTIEFLRGFETALDRRGQLAALALRIAEERAQAERFAAQQALQRELATQDERYRRDALAQAARLAETDDRRLQSEIDRRAREDMAAQALLTDLFQQQVPPRYANYVQMDPPLHPDYVAQVERFRTAPPEVQRFYLDQIQQERNAAAMQAHREATRTGVQSRFDQAMAFRQQQAAVNRALAETRLMIAREQAMRSPRGFSREEQAAIRAQETAINNIRRQLASEERMYETDFDEGRLVRIEALQAALTEAHDRLADIYSGYTTPAPRTMPTPPTRGDDEPLVPAPSGGQPSQDDVRARIRAFLRANPGATYEDYVRATGGGAQR